MQKVANLSTLTGTSIRVWRCRRWTALPAAFVLGLTAVAAADSPESFDNERERMVREQIEARGIHNAEILKAFRQTPRHLFVPASARRIAYEDHPVSIGHGATISQPYIVALMTELLKVGKGHRVLEIGTGSGYQAAILAQLCAAVYTVELSPELAQSAKDRLKSMHYTNVVVRHGDGFAGWRGEAPFDRIILTASPVELPQTLVDQLSEGGRLVAPLGPPGRQELTIIDKQPDGNLSWSSAGAVIFVPMEKTAGSASP